MFFDCYLTFLSQRTVPKLIPEDSFVYEAEQIGIVAEDDFSDYGK